MVKKETEFLKKIKTKFKVEGKVQKERRIWLTIAKDKLIEICKWMKENGYVHLSAISVTDWLKDGNYEITYHLWSYDDKILVTIKTKISRNTPIIDSVTQIWGNNAQIHERELHELFGVNFEGNNDLFPLFLENWKGPAPFRKDFDWRDFVRKEFYNKKNERELVYYD